MGNLMFTIRDLLWLTALVALATGWWLDHRSLTKQYEDYRQRIQRMTNEYAPGPGPSDKTPPVFALSCSHHGELAANPGAGHI